MFRFANIEMLWLLLLIPVLAAAYILHTRIQRRRLRSLGDAGLVAQLMPDASHTRPVAKFMLLLTALALLIIASARPQFGQKSETVKRQGIEVMIALDISNSMLAEDVVPNRLDRSKQMLSKMIDKMVDDKVGLVVFAGEAYVQLPITADYVSAKMFLNTIKPELIKVQGTALGAAVKTSVRAFGSERSEASRAIVLLTDGENHEDDAVAAVKEARGKGIHTYVVGIGKPEGSPIPVPGTGTFRKDRSGQVVVTKLNEQMCREIAQAGDGIYVRCDNTNTALKAVQNELDKLAKSEIETEVYTDFQEQYQSFVLLAMLLLLVEFFLLARQNRTISRWNIFGERKLVICLLALMPLAGFAQKEMVSVWRGNRQYEKENYTEAQVEYQRGVEQNSRSFVANYNLGNALFHQKKYEDAEQQYLAAAGHIDQEKEPQRMAATQHNLGNACFAQGKFAQAVDAYKKSLRLNPKDNETRYNLVKAMQMLQQQQQQQQQQGQQSEQKDSKEQNAEQQQAEQQQAEQQQAQQAEARETDEKMDKETAEQILQALEQDEQKTQENLQRQKGGKRRVDKDW